MEKRLAKKLISAAIHFVITIGLTVGVGILCRIFTWDNSYVIYSGLFGVILGVKEFVYYTIDRMRFNGFNIFTSAMGSSAGIWIGLIITK